MIILQNVSKLYHDSTYALRDVSFQISRGECCFILGPSGAGKTTLLKILHVIERPTKGQVYLFERDAGRLSGPDIQALRQHMGFIFQDYRLIDDWTVYDNIAVILQILGKSSAISAAESGSCSNGPGCSTRCMSVREPFRAERGSVSPLSERSSMIPTFSWQTSP